MSYILDALRKSEQERRNQEVVGSFESSMMSASANQAPDRKFLLVTIVVLLVLVNLSVLAFIFKDSLFQAPRSHGEVVSDTSTHREGRSNSELNVKSAVINGGQPEYNQGRGSIDNRKVDEAPNNVQRSIDPRVASYARDHYQEQSRQVSSVASDLNRVAVVESYAPQPEVIRPRAISERDRDLGVISNVEYQEPVKSGISQKYQDYQSGESRPKYDLVNMSSRPSIANPLEDILNDPQVIAPNSGQMQQRAQQKDLSAAEISRLPRIKELSLEQQAKVPVIKFSGHLYSSRPESRSVRFGDRKYKEGDWLDNNIELQTITEDGVVFNLDGHMFYMSSFEDWLGK